MTGGSIVRIERGYLVALAAGGCLFLGTSTAGAGVPAVHCGATLTKSTTLTADLVHCPGTGLVIGADGITVNLAGHTISGTNAPGSEGIANDGHAATRILAGRITDFRVNGVGIRGAQGAVVRGLSIRRIGAGGVEGEPVSAGIAIVDSPGSQAAQNDVQNDVSAFQSDGIDVLNSPGALVQGNRLSHNNWDGLVLIASSGSRIVGNDFDANGNNGTEVNGASDSVWMTGNGADGNTNIGIVLGSARDAHVVGNRARRNDVGLFFFDLHDSQISLNSASGNREGLDLAGGQFGSDGNQLIGNIASRNSSSGIGLFEAANNNLVARNVANENQGPVGNGGGIFVAASTGNQLIANVANANLDTGIGFFEDAPGDAAGNMVKGNTANRNQNHGIEAVAGTIDGGGNRAFGNAISPQCLNVVCWS
jgi:parallel beta-helix repeat protein